MRQKLNLKNAHKSLSVSNPTGQNVILLLSGLFCLVLVGCSGVTIENHEWCVIAGNDGAYCFHTISEEERELTKSEWDAVSPGWIAGSPEAFGNLKTVVEQLCSDPKTNCSYEKIERMNKVLEKVKEIQGLKNPVETTEVTQWTLDKKPL